MPDDGDAAPEPGRPRDLAPPRRVVGYARVRPGKEGCQAEIPSDWCPIIEQGPGREYAPPGYVWLAGPWKPLLVPVVWLEIRGDAGGRHLSVGESGPARTILLVDDDAAIRNGLRRLLETAGYTVLTAATPVEAIECAADHEIAIHVLLTDFVLPGITGTELAEVVVRGRPGLRVLYMSGHGEEDIAALGHAHPGAAFLQKPFAAGTLIQRVRELLDPGEEGGASRLGA